MELLDPETSRKWKIACVVATLLACAYVAATLGVRFHNIFDEWVADPDQRQAVWHYWRYNVDGAFPPGDFLTDYAFVMHAPLGWWLMMAGLSLFIEPVSAAIVLNVVAYLGTVLAAWWVVRAYTNHIVALIGGVLVAHSISFHLVTAGGYARSFGPLLVLLFLGTFIRKKHYWTLAVLVLQAALYPSVVIPCGLTYGFTCMLAPPWPRWRERIRATLETGAAGAVVVGFGLYQDVVSPKWWGSVVWLHEALKMPSWGRGGRIHEAPLRPPGRMLRLNTERVFQTSGSDGPLEPLIEFGNRYWDLPIFAVMLVLLVVLVVRREKFPLQPLLLICGAIAAYFLARLLAFKLYLPYRSLTHTFPYVGYVLFPILAYGAFRRWWPERRGRHTAAAVLTVLVPVLLFAGHGLGSGPRSTYSSRYERLAPMFRFVRELPLEVNIAGTFEVTDHLPLFAYHRVYVNRVLAHPFRKGFYAEAERRIELSYGALWAHDPCEIVDFVTKEKIDYLAFDLASTRRIGKNVFQPVRNRLTPRFAKNRKLGFYLAKPPKEIVAFEQRGYRIVDAAKLVERERASCEAP